MTVAETIAQLAEQHPVSLQVARDGRVLLQVAPHRLKAVGTEASVEIGLEIVLADGKVDTVHLTLLRFGLTP